MPSTITSSLLSALVLLSGAANAAPSLVSRNNGNGKGNNGKGQVKGRGNDPPFTIPALQLDSVVSCVGGIENAKKPFLLVPGTWANATMAYEPGWRQFLGKDQGGLGYDVCYVAPPPYMTDDIQETLEYIVNAVHRIYDASKTAMPIMGHSQGGLAIQSALTYYPSIRKEVSQFISLAGSQHGTTNVAVVRPEALTTTLRDPSVWAQGYTSNWITTLRQKGGFYAWVPTSALFSTADGTVRPQVANSLEGSATYIAGKMSGNVQVQESCANTTAAGTTGHNDFLISNWAYQVVKLAVASPKKFITTSEVKQAVSDGKIDCSVFYGPTVNQAAYNTTLALVGGFATGAPRVIAQTHAEALLRPYILSTKDNEVHDA